MSDTLSETMARRIFELAVETGQSAKLLDLLFDGGSVTIDAQTGRLVMVPANVLAQLDEVPEWCTCREPTKAGELEAIVRDLIRVGGQDPEGGFCTFCGHTGGQHAVPCVLRRAVEWVAAHPAEVSQ